MHLIPYYYYFVNLLACFSENNRTLGWHKENTRVNTISQDLENGSSEFRKLDVMLMERTTNIKFFAHHIPKSRLTLASGVMKRIEYTQICFFDVLGTK